MTVNVTAKHAGEIQEMCVINKHFAFIWYNWYN